MILYFLRHADAEDADGKPDDQRSLTEKGRSQAAAAGRLCKRLNLKLAGMYTSPRLRARQTADAVAGAVGLTPQVHEALNYGFNAGRLESLLREAPPGDLMLVGHEPTLSSTIRELTGGRVDMKKCGLARVDVPMRSTLYGELVWLLPPRLVAGLQEED